MSTEPRTSTDATQRALEDRVFEAVQSRFLRWIKIQGGIVLSLIAVTGFFLTRAAIDYAVQTSVEKQVDSRVTAMKAVFDAEMNTARTETKEAIRAAVLASDTASRAKSTLEAATDEVSEASAALDALTAKEADFAARLDGLGDELDATAGTFREQLARMDDDFRERVDDLRGLLNGMKTVLGSMAQEIDPAGKFTVDPLLAKLHDDSPDIHQQAVQALGALPDSREDETIPALLQALEDSDSKVARAAIRSFGEMGAAAESAIPDLLKRLQDETLSATVRGNVAMALGEIGVRSEVVVPALVAALSDSDWEVRNGAARGLWGFSLQIADQSPRGAAELAALLNDEWPSVRFAAVVALNRMGPAAKDAIPSLRRALRDEDADVRREAEEALRKLGEPIGRRRD